MRGFISLAFLIHMCLAQDPAVFQFRSGEFRVSESVLNAVVVIENVGNTAESGILSVNVADGTAVSGEDYAPTAGLRVSFSAGDASKEVTFPIIDDDVIESDETIQLSLRLLGPSRPSATIGSVGSATILIIDNDVPPSASNGGGNITLNTEAKIDIVCRPDYIEVTLKFADYPGIVVNDSVLHLEDMNCVAGYKDDEMVKFTFGLEECKTMQEDDGKRIYYNNMVYLKAGLPPNDTKIIRDHYEVIPFKCGYDKKTVLSKVSYNPQSTIILSNAEGIGNFTYFMDMYEDGSNSVAVTKFPKEVGLGQKMYFGFRVESGDNELVVFPDLCKATASSSYDSTPEHLIIEKACSRDNTLEYDYGAKAEHFFNVAAFRFKENYDDVFIHCKLTVCRKADDQSRCAKGCQPSKRRRRSSTEEEDFSADLYVGPMKLKRPANEEAETTHYTESETDSNMVMLVAVLVGVLGTVAIGLIVAVVVISRRRASVKKGAALIVAEEI